MHLLNAQAVSPDDDGEAVDLAQSSGDIVILSAADTEISGLAAAHAKRPADAPTLRLANLLKLRHPLSVDLYVERVVGRARLVILRLLGGRSYWSYGLEQVAATCRARGISLAALPGDDQPDPELDDWSTLDPVARHRLWQYLVHGGPANLDALLAYAGSLLGHDETFREPVPLLRAGVYWPGVAEPDLAAVEAMWRERWPIAALVFYRALVQGGDLRAIDALIDALREVRLNPLPLYVTSLKDPLAVATVDRLFADAPPEVVLNATGFAVGGDAGTPLDRPGRPVLQVVLASGDEAGWREGTRGLSPRDLAMHVALPEVDGRVLTRAIAFKSAQGFDPRSETPVVGFEPAADRVRFTARLAAAWTRLARTPPAERRVAVLLANYPNRDGRIANGVGLDVPASAVNLLNALRAQGYQVDDPPGDGAVLV
ncbi:MAG: cobaltochelatase subunit CobN, partial [Geminicoccaceae bacterium]|nr:cobaltochelatase subunit CobN [Geminicoccaceae bacterium]